MSTALAPRRRASSSDLTGRQKVAILLMAMGEENSAEITKNLDAEEVEAISFEIARLKDVTPELVQQVVEATRHEALEPIRQGIRHSFGAVGADAAQGLKIRHDHGSQYMSRDFQREIRFLGAESSPAFVRAPEGNGCAERFIRTLKENLLWVRWFETIEELRQALLAFQRTYNELWLIERHGHRPPAAIRKEQTVTNQKAA